MSSFHPLSQDEQQSMCRNLGLTLTKENECNYQVSSTLGLPFTTHCIKGDGNCLFRAISYAICGKEDHHAYIRSVIVSYIASSKHGKNIVPHEQNSYLSDSRMTENGIWGTDVEILGAASLFGVNIYVFSKYGFKDDWLAFKPVHAKKKVEGAIYLHHKDGNHYDVVTSVVPSHVEHEDAIDTEPVNLCDSEVLTEDLSLQEQCDLSDYKNEAESDEDLFDFDLTEFHSPISTSTPCKIMNKGTDDKLKEPSNLDKTSASDQDISIFNSSFEDALSRYRLTGPSYRKGKAVLHSKAMETSKEAFKSNCSEKCLKTELTGLLTKSWKVKQA